jgi:branched-chain amino acid transport system permease protein
MLASISIATPLIVGLGNGAAFGLVAIGLVLIYKSSRVFNFAAGEFVTIGAFFHYVGRKTLHLPYGLAMLVGILAGLAFGLLTERLVVRPLANRPKVTALVGTAAVTIIAIPLEIMIGGAKTFPAPPIIKGLGPKVFGVFVSPQQLSIVVVLLGAAFVLALFFGVTDLGLATLATSQEPTASRLVGIRLNRVSMLTWGMAGLLGGLAGVLLAPVTSTFHAGFGTTDVLIPAFTGAVLGGMTSVPGAFVGSLIVGVVQAMAQFNISTSTLPGANSVAILVVLVAVLVVRPTGLLGREA